MGFFVLCKDTQFELCKALGGHRNPIYISVLSVDILDGSTR